MSVILSSTTSSRTARHVVSRAAALAVTSVAVLYLAAGVGSATGAGSHSVPGDHASAGASFELVTAGGPPTYVPSTTTSVGWTPPTGVTGLHTLHWGDGGPPALVPIDEAP